MTKIFTKQEIMEVIPKLDLISEIEKGFIAFSEGNVNVPPIGEMIFDEPPGEVHIKSGYITHDEYYVIKIASGFNNNLSLGLATNNGVMLVFSSKTGQLLAVLLDEGYLTALQTAAAGAIAAKYLAPKKITKIGIIGTGIQARLQLEYLEKVTTCKDVMVWGRSETNAKKYALEMEEKGFNVTIAKTTADIGSNCNLIVTTTPAVSPIILDKHIRKGTHITAIGSDTSEKNELEPVTLARANIVVTDSLEQCRTSGEIFQTWINGLISDHEVLELGNIIKDKAFQRSADNQLTIADLTGVAVQDIQIAKAVYKQLAK
jgi:ornithine cyclodeaminase